MDLTILIPTKNRTPFIKKILAYYNAYNFKGKIIFIDSSDEKIFLINQREQKKFKNLDTEIFRVIGFPWQVIKKISNKINTKFVIYSGDDDFLIIETLKKIVEKLINDISYSAYCGNGLIYSYSEKKKLS